MAFQNQCVRAVPSHHRACRRTPVISLYLLLSLIVCFSTTGPSAAQSVQNQSSQPIVKTIATRLRGFGVPFSLNADDSQFIELHLYVTKDQGRTWQFYGSESTDSQEFPFKTDKDGEYWFALKTLNRDKKLLPEGTTKPELKVIVDTVKPILKGSVDSDAAGRIVCRWEAKDKNIDPSSLKILY